MPLSSEDALSVLEEEEFFFNDCLELLEIVLDSRSTTVLWYGQLVICLKRSLAVCLKSSRPTTFNLIWEIELNTQLSFKDGDAAAAAPADDDDDGDDDGDDDDDDDDDF